LGAGKKTRKFARSIELYTNRGPQHCACLRENRKLRLSHQRVAGHGGGNNLQMSVDFSGSRLPYVWREKGRKKRSLAEPLRDAKKRKPGSDPLRKERIEGPSQEADYTRRTSPFRRDWKRGTGAGRCYRERLSRGESEVFGEEAVLLKRRLVGNFTVKRGRSDEQGNQDSRQRGKSKIRTRGNLGLGADEDRKGTQQLSECLWRMCNRIFGVSQAPGEVGGEKKRIEYQLEQGTKGGRKLGGTGGGGGKKKSRSRRGMTGGVGHVDLTTTPQMRRNKKREGKGGKTTKIQIGMLGVSPGNADKQAPPSLRGSRKRMQM